MSTLVSNVSQITTMKPEEYSTQVLKLKNLLAQKNNALQKLIVQARNAQGQQYDLKLAVYGLLNSGKSSLLNVLTDHLDKEFFATGDHRVTTQNKVFKTKTMTYIDTPGLDGDIQDNLYASIGKDKASIVLFVHSASKELECSEISLLQELKQHLGAWSEEAIVLVLSRKDSIEPSNLDKVKNKIEEQCNEFLGMKLKIVEVSSYLFLKAHQESEPTRKERFLELSNINLLKTMIEDLQGSMNPSKIEQTKLIQKFEALAQEISFLKSQLANLRVVIKRDVNQRFSGAVKSARDSQEWIRGRSSTMDKIQEIHSLNAEIADLRSKN